MKKRARIIDKGSFRVKEKVVPGDKVLFIFTAMGTRIGLYNLFVQVLNRRGYSTIVYDYPLDMLWRADFDEWRRFYADIIADGQKRLEEHKTRGAKHFYAYGVSMGTLIANKFTRDTKEISHVVLNLTYGDVAANIWSYRGVHKTKKALERRGVTIEQLRANIQYADPIATASELRGKKVMLHLAKNDRVLIYKHTKYTKKAFEEAGLELLYSENKFLGHYLAAAKNMVSLRKLESFLKS